MSDDLLDPDGGIFYRDPNAERDADHYGPGTGGKKRKVPAFAQAIGRQDEISTSADEDEEENLTETSRFTPLHRPPRSKAASACAFRKALYLRRKAALITLYIDAQNAITNGSVKPGTQGLPQIMDIRTFEKLLPSLEDIGMSDWPPDRLNWRSRWEGQVTTKSKTLEQWRTGFDQRLRRKASQKPTVRGGWAPEGSFEFEMTSRASQGIHSKNKDRAQLHKLVVDLRALTLSAKPAPQVAGTPSSSDKPPSKTPRLTSTKKEDGQMMKESLPLSRTESKESDPASTKGKSKKKKKKRSVLANQGNPHHVDNCKYRPNRKVAANSDPYEPYPHHESLLFPPPMRLLSTVPQRRTAPLPGSNASSEQIRAGEDEFICCFCEMDLFFGTEAARKRAIRRMKQERRRKEAIRNKAKDFAEGKGKLRDDESEYDEDEEWCGEEDAHGRCTCGRQISEPHRAIKGRLKPPDPDPPPDGHDYHDHDDYAYGGHTCGQSDHYRNVHAHIASHDEADFIHDDLD